MASKKNTEISLDSFAASRTPLQEFWHHFKRNKPALFGSMAVLVLAFFAITGYFFTEPLVEQYPEFNPNTSDLVHQLTPPSFDEYERGVTGKNDEGLDESFQISWTALFGTDSLGRDLGLRLWSGARVSLLVGIFSVGISVTIGILIGGIAGFFGRGRARFPFLLSVVAPPIGVLVSTFEFLGSWAGVCGWLLIGLGIAALLLQIYSAVRVKAWKVLGFFAFAVLLLVYVFGYNIIREHSGIEGEATQSNAVAVEVLDRYIDSLGEARRSTQAYEVVASKHARYLEANPEATVASDKTLKQLEEEKAAARSSAEGDQLTALKLQAEYAWRKAAAEYYQAELKLHATKGEGEELRSELMFSDIEDNSERSQLKDSYTGISREIQAMEGQLEALEKAMQAAADAESEAMAKTTLAASEFSSSQVMSSKDSQSRQSIGVHNKFTRETIAQITKSDSLYGINRNIPLLIIVGFIFVVAFLLLVKSAQESGTDDPVLKRLYVPLMTIDNFVMRSIEILMTIPRLFLLLTILAFYDKSIWLVMFVIGITSWMGTARFVRAEILSLRERDFIQAARSLGVKDFGVILKHLVPNALSPVLVSATLGVADAVLLESTLSFLGLGAGQDEVTWGKMLAEGRQYISTAPWLTIVPGIAILVLVLAFNLLGEGMREALNPKLRKR